MLFPGVGMKLRGLLFDLNGTVIDILTDEGCDELYRMMTNLLEYQGISLPPETLRKLYFELNKGQRRASAETYPEFDVIALFRQLLEECGSDVTRKLPKRRREQLPLFLAEAFRAASRFRLRLYPGVTEVLDELRKTYLLAAVSDGQACWALPELRAVGLADYFEPVIISSDLGFRKPDPRIFERALKKLKLSPEEVLFVGNDMFRDVYGARELGIRTVFFKSNQGEQRPMGAEPDYIIYDFRQLPEAIRFLRSRF